MNNRKIFAKALFENIYNKLINVEKIQSAYGENEVRTIAYLLTEHFAGANRTDIVINRQKSIPVEKLTALDAAIKRIGKHEPIQYVIGEAFFYGRKFLVNPDVLIPRRETEELVQLIIHENQGQKKLKILDIGTGSGCIAITLKKEMEAASVAAIDVSEAALQIATANAQLHQAVIHFCRADICASDFFMKNEQNKLYHFDIIVSNPPYVRNSETVGMHKNVVEYEPHIALFVSDNDPLIFYKAIVSLIRESANTEMGLLKEEGGIFFEVNESLANEVAVLLEKNNFKKVRIVQDLQQKNRIVSGRLKIAW